MVVKPEHREDKPIDLAARIKKSKAENAAKVANQIEEARIKEKAIEFAEARLKDSVRCGVFKKGFERKIHADALRKEILLWLDRHEEHADVMGRYVSSVFNTIINYELWEKLTRHWAKDPPVPGPTFPPSSLHRTYYRAYEQKTSPGKVFEQCMRIWIDEVTKQENGLSDEDLSPAMQDYIVNFMCSFHKAMQKRRLRPPGQPPEKTRDILIAETVEWVTFYFNLNPTKGEDTDRESGSSIVEEALKRLGVKAKARTIGDIHGRSREAAVLHKWLKENAGEWPR